MSIGKTSQAYVEASKCIKELTEGCIVSVDPSAGSSSSMPAWAVYRSGSYIASGIFELELGTPLPFRLKALGNKLRKLYSTYSPDVLVYEEIPAQRHGFGNAGAHASLLKSLGVILSVPGPDHYVGISPVSWKGQARPEYVKGDEEDAIEIGHVVIQLAYHIKKHEVKKK